MSHPPLTLDYDFSEDLMTEVHERNCALRAVGREKETESISLVVSMGTGEPPLGKEGRANLQLINKGGRAGNITLRWERKRFRPLTEG